MKNWFLSQIILALDSSEMSLSLLVVFFMSVSIKVLNNL